MTVQLLDLKVIACIKSCPALPLWHLKATCPLLSHLLGKIEKGILYGLWSELM